MAEATGRRYSSRNRANVERLDPSGSGQSYDKALLQYMCMAQIVEQQKQKQMSLNRGLTVWGNKGLQGVKAELSQVHFRNVFTPLDPSELSQEQIRNTLESHMFLEEKRNLNIKGRIVAGVTSSVAIPPSKKLHHPHYTQNQYSVQLF